MRRLLRMLKLRPEMLNVLVLAGMEEDANE
jgi:hypothetical protein